MRILLVNKFYYPQGGADKHVLQLEQLLTKRGHEVAVFAMQHPKNQPSTWSKYFVSQVDFSHVRLGWQGIRTAARMFHSFEAARKMDALIRDFKPDVAHLHNIYHQISPSVLKVIAKHDVPIVMTLHDYALASANYTLYAHGGICEHGKRGRWWEYIIHRCIKHSLLASILAAVDQWWHDRTKPYERYVGTFISPSRFLADVIHDWRGASLPITILPNFTDTVPLRQWPKDGSVVYVGRLSHEKGVATLVRAARQINGTIHIIGTGPEEATLKALAAANGVTNMIWHGFQTGTALNERIAKASAMVVPSEWYENNPLTILEAFAAGTPVVGSRMGGIPELIREGETGALFPAGDATALAATVNGLLKDHDRLAMLSSGAVAAATAHTPQGYLDRLEGIYASARTR